MPKPTLAVLTGALVLAAGASAQTTVEWNALSGWTPAEDVPTWWTSLGAYGSTQTCELATQALGPASLLVDSSGCATDVALHRAGFRHGLYPTPPTQFVEGVLRVRSSLGQSADDGPAAMSITLLQNCTWSLHVDVGRILLHHGSQVVASTVTTTNVTPRLFRLEVDPAGRSARVLVDGIQRLSYDASGDPPCSGASFRWVFFGDLSYEEGGLVEWFSVRHDASNGFATFCEAQPNSLGRTPYLTYSGSNAVAANSIELRTGDLPPSTFGIFLCSREHAAPFFAPGSQGTLCLGGSVGRFSRPGEIVNVPPSGIVAYPIDLTDLPQPTGAVSAVPGDSWNFQFWYRDANPGTTSNLSGALQISLE